MNPVRKPLQANHTAAAPQPRRQDFALATMHRAPSFEETPLEHHGLIRTGIWTYVAGLLLIAAVSLAFHFITAHIVQQQEQTGRIVNISGRQRMLTQRIVRLALERAAHSPFRSDAEDQAQMRAALKTLSTSHAALVNGSASLGISAPTSAVVHQVYFGDPYQLDARMQEFLMCAESLTNKPASEVNLNDPDLAIVERAAHEPLLNALSAAVTAYQTSSEASIRNLGHVLTGLMLLMLVLLALEAAFLYRPLFKRLRLAQDQLIEMARTDPLTGSLNRRAFTQEAHRVLAEARHIAQPLAVLMIDIDKFKNINDTFGHPAGDLVINTVVATLLANTSTANLICRMGGEEFAILLRNSTMADALHEADKLRTRIEQTLIALPSNQEVSITVSMGAAMLHAGDTSLFQLLQRADQALYLAKRNGRNRVEAETLHTETDHSIPFPVRAS